MISNFVTRLDKQISVAYQGGGGLETLIGSPGGKIHVLLNWGNFLIFIELQHPILWWSFEKYCRPTNNNN